MHLVVILSMPGVMARSWGCSRALIIIIIIIAAEQCVNSASFNQQKSSASILIHVETCASYPQPKDDDLQEVLLRSQDCH